MTKLLCAIFVLLHSSFGQIVDDGQWIDDVTGNFKIMGTDPMDGSETNFDLSAPAESDSSWNPNPNFVHGMDHTGQHVVMMALGDNTDPDGQWFDEEPNNFGVETHALLTDGESATSDSGIVKIPVSPILDSNNDGQWIDDTINNHFIMGMDSLSHATGWNDPGKQQETDVLDRFASRRKRDITKGNALLNDVLPNEMDKVVARGLQFLKLFKV